MRFEFKVLRSIDLLGLVVDEGSFAAFFLNHLRNLRDTEGGQKRHFLAQRKKGEGAEDTKLDVDGGSFAAGFLNHLRNLRAP